MEELLLGPKSGKEGHLALLHMHLRDSLPGHLPKSPRKSTLGGADLHLLWPRLHPLPLLLFLPTCCLLPLLPLLLHSQRKSSSPETLQKSLNNRKVPSAPYKMDSERKKGKKVKKQPNNILKEIKNSLRSVQEKKMEDSSRPSTPQRSVHENLMEAIRGSSIRQLRRVEVPEALR